MKNFTKKYFILLLNLITIFLFCNVEKGFTQSFLNPNFYEDYKEYYNANIIIANSSNDISKLYYNLERLLKENNFRDADLQTLEIIKQAVIKNNDYTALSYVEIKSIDCDDLNKLDSLWYQYSNGKFGFKVQKDLWFSINESKLVRFANYSLYGLIVGWVDKKNNISEVTDSNHFLSYDQLDFSLNASNGHLPVLGLPSYALGEGNAFYSGSILDKEYPYNLTIDFQDEKGSLYGMGNILSLTIALLHEKCFL